MNESPLSQINVTREQFNAACDAVWTEIEYQNSLPIRTEDEANSVASFLTLIRCYARRVEDAWTFNPGTVQEDGKVQVTDALHGLRKLAAIAVRSMIYNGIRSRVKK
jgi:hypothetical protein